MIRCGMVCEKTRVRPKMRKRAIQISHRNFMQASDYWNQVTVVYNPFMTFPSKPTTKNCSRCGKGFQCGTIEADGNCWCSHYPTLKVKSEADCMCSDCLMKATLLQSLEEKNP